MPHMFRFNVAQESDPLTFEDLSSVYRVEMKAQTLAETRRDLYPALVRLQNDVQKEYESEYSKDPDSIMCEGINERRKKVNRLVQQIIDLRMEKVAMMALRTSMGANNPIDKLTQEEREYYNVLTEISKKHRGALGGRLKKDYTIPDIAGTAGGRSEETDTARPVRAHTGEENIEHPSGKADGECREEMIVIRILEDLPKIAGPDCDYDLRKEDVVRMPATLANALVNHSKAVVLNITP